MSSSELEGVGRGSAELQLFHGGGGTSGAVRGGDPALSQIRAPLAPKPKTTPPAAPGPPGRRLTPACASSPVIDTAPAAPGEARAPRATPSASAAATARTVRIVRARIVDVDGRDRPVGSLRLLQAISGASVSQEMGSGVFAEGVLEGGWSFSHRAFALRDRSECRPRPRYA